MKWHLDTSKERASKQWETLTKTPVTVKRLTREMDLTNLSPSDVRIVHGTHLYLGITNFSNVVENTTLRRDDFKPLHRYMHALRVELRRIVQQVFGGDKIQVQGDKFHAILYKPYDDDEKLAWHTVLMGVTLIQAIRKSLPKVFAQYPALTPTVGIDLGDTLVANIGVQGDRELISIGSAANHAAHLLGAPNAVTITKELWDKLPSERQRLFTKVNSVYRLGALDVEACEEFVSGAGFVWSQESSEKELAATLESLPLRDIESHEADVRIELLNLGPKHFKTCSAGTMFVDMDGYTALVDSLLGEPAKLVEAVKLLHLFRYELQQVTERDFDGVSVQHQGDRLQAIIHLPKGNDDSIKAKIGEMCVSFNSSVEEMLNIHYVVFKPYHVAIGAAYGKTIVVRSGTRGDLDASCFGDAVLRAEELQFASHGNEIRVAKDVFAAMDKDLQAMFTFDKVHDCYAGQGVTWSKVEDHQNAKQYAAGAAVGFNTITGGIEFHHGGGHSKPHVQPVKNTRNWGY